MRMEFITLLVFLLSITGVFAEVVTPEVLVSSEEYLIRKHKIFVTYDGRTEVKDVIISKDNKKTVVEI